MTRNKTRRLTLAAMMGAVSFVLMYFSFSVPVLSPFADFDLSGLPDLIGGFILGPVGAVEIIAVKVLLKLVFKGTSSMFTGEIQKFLLCTAYTLPAVLYYRKHRTKKGAAVGLVIGSICGVIVAVLTNVFLIFPAYMTLYGHGLGVHREHVHRRQPMDYERPDDGCVLYSSVQHHFLQRDLDPRHAAVQENQRSAQEVRDAGLRLPSVLTCLIKIRYRSAP